MAVEKKHKQRRKPANIDLEETRPHHFYIHEPRTRVVLKGEGTFKGSVFELTSWRREGLLGRLRDQGFVVRTLADQVERLPRAPRPTPIGAEVHRPVMNIVERFSYFDALALSWVPIEPHTHNDTQVLTFHAGWVVRRRRGRGNASFYEVFAERSGGTGLRILNESEALLAGYAQATAARERDLVARHSGKFYLLPALELPQRYRDVLARLAELTPDGWRIHERGWPLVQEMFARLGLLLRGIESSIEASNIAQPKGDTQREPTDAKPQGKNRKRTAERKAPRER